MPLDEAGVRDAARRITVAIDPGHGGEDPGAIGRRGTYEKHVALAISRKLKAILDGECDEMPEQAFYMVGTMEQAREKAKKMAAAA